jgi:photosynthetic reaction center cytochrome c subunit
MNASRPLAIVATALAALTLAGCERPPIDTVQRGYRGTGMLELFNPRIEARVLAANQVPAATPAVPPGGPLARDVYKNVQVLTDLDVGQFTRLMVAMTAWVSPEQGCNYCHVEGNFEADGNYAKAVSRRMLQMTRHVNVDWKNHVADTGVTCWTCHRGQPVPSAVWFADPGPPQAGGLMRGRALQNAPAPSVGLASLPYDPFTPYLLEARPIRVASATALPVEKTAGGIMHAEWTYGLMTHFSESLGVNCTYCHNTRSFMSWEGPPQRVTAYYGIQMVRDLNNGYLVPLQGTYPPNRLGPLGDAPKANCATCHQGLYKPLNGVSMLADYPALAVNPPPAPPAPAVPAPVVQGDLVIIYFAVASSSLHEAAPQSLGMIVASLQANPKARATISGYHSATGDPSANQELAKNRALAVQGALKSAGIADNRVVLEKPIVVQGNVAGEDPSARRVEVTVK